MSYIFTHKFSSFRKYKTLVHFRAEKSASQFFFSQVYPSHTSKLKVALSKASRIYGKSLLREVFQKLMGEKEDISSRYFKVY